MSDIITITQLAKHITALMREDDLLASVTVAGEISNPVLAKSGHFYFSLKDAGATIGCVMWRSAVRALFEIPQAGQSVIAHGRVDLYAPRGQLQLVVDALRPEGGIGELYRRFEEIKNRLQEE
jgi:exodeoxyribonuclease VII large subunit